MKTMKIMMALAAVMFGLSRSAMAQIDPFGAPVRGWLEKAMRETRVPSVPGKPAVAAAQDEPRGCELRAGDRVINMEVRPRFPR